MRLLRNSASSLAVVGVVLAAMFIGSIGSQARAQEPLVQANEKLWPENVVQTATEHWNTLEALRRKHVAALKELERAVSEGDKQTNRVGERVALIGRIMTTELELARKPAERETICKEAIERVSKLGGVTDKLDRLFVDAARAGFEVELHLAKYPARSGEEVQALVEQAEAAVNDYRWMHERNKVGVGNVTSGQESLAAFNLCLRVAELERAIGRHEEALKRQTQACEYANRYAEISVAAYQAGMQTFDQLMEVQRDRATTWLALARVDPAAAKELRRALKEAGEKR